MFQPTKNKMFWTLIKNLFLLFTEHNEELRGFFFSRQVIISYHIISYHTNFASQKYTVVIIKDLQQTYETWRFKIPSLLQLRLHGGMTYKERICCWQELAKSLKALPSSNFVFKCCFILYPCLKEAQFTFKFKYFFFDFTLKEILV